MFKKNISESKIIQFLNLLKIFKLTASAKMNCGDLIKEYKSITSIS